MFGGRNLLNIPPPPVHLCGYVAFNNCQMSSPFGLQLCHAHTTTFASQLQTTSGGSIGKQSAKNYIFEPSVCLIADGALENIPTMSAQRLTLKLNWYTRSRMRCVLRPEMTVRHTLTQKTLLSTQRILCNHNTSTASWYRSHSQNCIHKGRSSRNTSGTRVTYPISYSKVLVPQKQMWHLYCLVSEQSVGDLHPWQRRCYTSCLAETVLHPSTSIGVW